MIDRFDVRAHLDTLPSVSTGSPKLTPEEDWEERQANYERYRILIQNDFLASKYFLIAAVDYFPFFLFFRSIHPWRISYSY